MNIGKELRTIMAQRNIKNHILAKNIGFNKSTISSWRTGKTFIKEESLDKLLNFLNISRSEFFKLGESDT